MQGWAYLFASVAFEVVGTLAIKESNGMSRLVPTLVVIVSFAAAFWLFGLAVRTVALGPAYAVWSGAATAIITLVGVFWMGDTMTPAKLGSMVLIVLGMIGLHLATEG